MRMIAGVLVGAFAALAMADAAQASPADRDPSFGSLGRVLEDLGADTRFEGVAPAPNGDIVAVGTRQPTATVDADPAFVARYSASGQPSPGVVAIPAGNAQAQGAAVAVDSQNRMLVALELPDGDLRVARLDPSGALDDTFSGDGLSAVVDVDADTVNVVGIDVTSTDRPVVVATHNDGGPKTFVGRWTTAGLLDPSFSNPDGKLAFGPSVAATDMLVDASDRVLIARNRFDANGRDVLRIATDGNSNVAFAVPSNVETSNMRIALSGTDIVIAGAEPTSIEPNNARVSVARLKDDGSDDPAFSDGSHTIINRVNVSLEGVAALADGRVVATFGADDVFVTPSGTPRRVGMVRFASDGAADATFNPGFGGAQAFDDLGTAKKAEPVGGLIRVADDKVVVAGRTFAFEDDGGAGDQGFVARYGAPGTKPTAHLTRGYRAFGDPASVHDFARPGQAIDLSAASSTDPDGPISQFAYDLDADGAFETLGGATAVTSFTDPGIHRVTVRVSDETGLTDTSFTDVEVRANLAPGAAMLIGQDTFDPQELRTVLREDKPTVFKVNATDIDGNVKKIEWDIDGVPGYEKDIAATFRTFEDKGTIEVGVRVTDDEGKQTERRETLTIIAAACDDATTLSFGRLRATAECWKKDIDDGGKTTRWKASESPPQFHLAGTIGQAVPLSQLNQFDFDGRATINGIVFTDYELLQIVKQDGKPTQVQFVGADVETASPQATRLLLNHDATDFWKLEGNALTSVAARGAYAGLDVGELLDDKIELPAAGKARLRFFPLLPAVFGGVSSDEAVQLDVGATASSAQAGADCFRSSAASLPGLDFLQDAAAVDVCHSTTDATRWSVKANVDLGEFTGGVFPGLPRVKLQAEIANGELAGAAAAAEFDPGIPFAGPVFLTGVNFELLLAQAQFVKASCVPKIGVETKSMQAVRDAFIGFGLPAADVYDIIPDFRYDYGTPTSALCGGVTFRVGMPAIELARGNISLGVANYDDGRPDAFRMIGQARVLDAVTLNARAGVYTNGYMDMRVSGYAELFDLLSLEAQFNLAVDIPNKKFNAQAYLEGCIIPVDACAGIRALLSSRGVGACLLLSFLGGDWNPGATYSWNDGLTIYFSGCDLGDVRVNFSGEGSTIITPVFVEPPGSRALRGEPPAPPTATAAQEKHEQVIDLPKGLPGAYIAVKGQNGALAKFTVEGPGGLNVLVDGSASPKWSQDPTRVLMFDVKRGISHVMLPEPAGGRYRVVPQAGSAPITEVVSSEGLKPAAVKASVGGTGRSRVLRYEITPVDGQAVRFEERGPTGKQFLGVAKGARGELRFTSAAGRAESRKIVAVVEQDGMLREEIPVVTYKAPATGRPTKVGRIVARRKGKTLTIRWLRSGGARRYTVTARLSDGRVVRKVQRGRSLTLRRVSAKTTGRISVAGVNEVSQSGKPVTYRLKAARTKAKKKRA